MEKQCEHCRKDFVPPHFNSKYCSISCKRSFHSKKYRERIKRYNRKYYAENTDKYRQLWKDYYQANRENLSTRSRERYHFLKENNPDLIQKWNKNGGKRYRQTEKGKLASRLDNHRRRCLDKIDKKAWLEKLDSFGGKCAECGSSEKITIDHIVPVVLGGTNAIENLQPLCSSCNSSKGAKLKDEEKVRHSK